MANHGDIYVGCSKMMEALAIDGVWLCMWSCSRLAAIAFGGQNRAKSQRTVHQAEHHADMTTRCWNWTEWQSFTHGFGMVVSRCFVLVCARVCLALFSRHKFGIARTDSCSTMLEVLSLKLCNFDAVSRLVERTGLAWLGTTEEAKILAVCRSKKKAGDSEVNGRLHSDSVLWCAVR